MAGIFDALGSFGHSVIERSRALGRSLLETIGLLQAEGIEVSIEESTGDWDSVGRLLESAPLYQGLAEDSLIPRAWHEDAPIPWARPWAYKVAVYGRNLETGELERQEFDLPVSRQLTVGEALQVAYERIGEEGGSPLFEIYDARVIGAYVRAGG